MLKSFLLDVATSVLKSYFGCHSEQSGRQLPNDVLYNIATMSTLAILSTTSLPISVFR